MFLKDGHADHGAALIAQILAHVGEVEQAAGGLQHAAVHVVVELEPRLHDFQIDRIVVDQVHEHLLHAPRRAMLLMKSMSPAVPQPTANPCRRSSSHCARMVE